MPQIEFINVSKEYDPGKKVLDDVIFKVEPGEFMFVVGPSGAGKSTIIKLLTKEETPEGGDILFNGESIINIPKESVPDLRRKIGVVFQDFRLLDSKTVFDNVAVALEVADSSLEEIRSIVPNVLNMVGLTDKMFKYPKQLSGGEKQKVAIARALAHEPDVILADEPTGMIDPDSVDDVLEVLEKINSLGTTVIMATHDQEIVNAMKKRVLRIERGQIISDKKGGKYRA
ncbi:cell division ATP-binding protein FtsE [candidate division WWE3 bacterium RIFOXYD1_FULL_43_17]|uniref:Cell division ATP-binding protein FtsE n=3 Tax=Katanobacteria TaxID=422282 RepID=A0A1F4XEQ2_UNCKA|nr:MAG: Cell division ATP-binding protein FtsE [candidate division WWE3 bacterium GW2011_GWE1_41_27]KKS59194.1 MAG: Cell division ATP-binding protein FtsE [candidate division WWE3 bacterium GW2011_GWF2_42_42]OGC80141.1 MAG: cell division ATP-binding protein FtsE [candidate division WWE3 bacterium RIFOXYD1_FULL_43_17]